MEGSNAWELQKHSHVVTIMYLLLHRSYRTAIVRDHRERVGFSPTCRTPPTMASSAAAQQGGWAELPEELLLLMALERVGWGGRESAAMLLTCSRWSRTHDGGRTTLLLRDGATDESVVALCRRMPALTRLDLRGASSLTAMQAVT